MPDAEGRFKGTGWSRKAAASWERVFNGDGAELAAFHKAVDYGRSQTPADRDAKVKAWLDTLFPPKGAS